MDMIFADPPYDYGDYALIPELVFRKEWLKKNAWLIIEHPKGVDFTRHEFFSQQRKYGKVNFSFFSSVND